MASILRGEIYRADLDLTLGHDQSGPRPVLVLSEDIFNARSGTIIAIAVTSQEPKAAFPLSVELVGTDLPKRSWARISQIRTLSTKRLAPRVGEASAQDVLRVIEGLSEILCA